MKDVAATWVGWYGLNTVTSDRVRHFRSSPFLQTPNPNTPKKSQCLRPLHSEQISMTASPSTTMSYFAATITLRHESVYRGLRKTQLVAFGTVQSRW